MIAKYLSALVFFTVSGCVAGPQDDSAAEDGASSVDGLSGLPDGDYVLHPVHSNKCVDVAAASTQNGARVQQYSCNGTVAQVFHLTSLGGDLFEITNPHSGKALDITDVKLANRHRALEATISVLRVAHGLLDQVHVTQAAGDKLGAAVHRRTMPFRKIIEDGNAVPGVKKFFHTNRTDVAGAACDKNIHREPA